MKQFMVDHPGYFFLSVLIVCLTIGEVVHAVMGR